MERLDFQRGLEVRISRSDGFGCTALIQAVAKELLVLKPSDFDARQALLDQDPNEQVTLALGNGGTFMRGDTRILGPAGHDCVQTGRPRLQPVQRRAYFRVPVRVPVRIRREGRLAFGLTHDVSAGGSSAVLAAVHLEKDEVVQLSIDLTGGELEVDARVVDASDLHRFQFQGISSRDRDRLAAFVQRTDLGRLKHRLRTAG